MQSTTVNGLKKNDRVRIAGPVEAKVIGTRKLKKSELNLTTQAAEEGVDQYTVQVELASPSNIGDVFLLLEDDDLPVGTV
jgi:hypothetical protein